MLELGVKFLIAYFLGSVMGAWVVGALYGGVDIRTMGSGNAGATNALRTKGWVFALGVVVIDIGKGMLGAGVVPGLALPFPPDQPAAPPALLEYACAAGAVLGHVWPVWQHFRGGKGAATLIGTLVVLSPVVLLVVLSVWLLMLTLFGFVGLATMAAAVTAPIYVVLTRLPQDEPLFLYLLFCAALVIFTHRSNIRRMRDGEEPRNTRMMLLRRSAR